MKKKGGEHSRAVCDYHHIFYQKRYWSRGYAKALRNCEYGGKLIPRDTLHRRIHRELTAVPVPSGKGCKIAFEAMLVALNNGWIDPINDSLETMITFYIDVWKNYELETVNALKKQLEVIRSYKGL